MNTTDDKNRTCTVFNIQKYSVHDGPGIRTVVFLKGCPLRCLWCSNPESQEAFRQIAFNEGRCLGEACTRCIEACPHGSITRPARQTLAIDRAHCRDCDQPCTKACPPKALISYGEVRTVDDILRVVEQDGQFYARSEGGMTISGGEPLFQANGALALLREAKRRHINTAAETCGLAPWEILDAACGILDTLLFDIKHPDPAQHKEGTGISNSQILGNFHNVMQYHPDLPVLVRTPVIPGFNDSEEAINGILDILEPYPRVEYQLLAYHRLGTQKYQFLHRDAPMGEVTLPSERFTGLQKLVTSRRG
ncbi:glycyl-radical enzyme activating protein [Solidesulfovibrio sp. C21]|uniref:glycyl-radical enzyme activating protein n=1 Tax=Solidesulfovibrio sp. C21 TaxID=3398613 RepID=UPI0039FDB854